MARLEALTEAECWRRLGTEGLGRIGFDRGRGPRIHPVNYTVVDRTLHVRTSGDSELGAFADLFADGALVSVQVDQLAPTVGERWSVLVTGRLARLGDDARAALLPGRDPAPAPAGPRPVLLGITPVEVSGRRLLAERPTDASTTGDSDASLRWTLPANWLG